MSPSKTLAYGLTVRIFRATNPPLSYRRPRSGSGYAVPPVCRAPKALVRDRIDTDHVRSTMADVERCEAVAATPEILQSRIGSQIDISQVVIAAIEPVLESANPLMSRLDKAHFRCNSAAP